MDVVLAQVTDMDQLREISWLFAEVWGPTPEGVPMHSESLRAVGHAGGLVSSARDRDSGELLGAAVLGRDVPGACYSYLTAARRGAEDRGVGRALKQHQRTWALAHDLHVMTWTYDPLVARNGRFNLTRLGATVRELEPAFYGVMSDDLNGHDVGDRLVVRWQLDSERTRAALDGRWAEPEEDPVAAAPSAARVANGPDGIPALVVTDRDRWLRVPADVVALRRTDPDQARAWRSASTGWLQEAFAAGLQAVGVSRSGWYHLRPADV